LAEFGSNEMTAKVSATACANAMSALGHKQTLEQASEMSALPTKADMRLAIQKCPLSAKSRRDDRVPTMAPDRTPLPPVLAEQALRLFG
jgi:hypothetical protein